MDNSLYTHKLLSYINFFEVCVDVLVWLRGVACSIRLVCVSVLRLGLCNKKTCCLGRLLVFPTESLAVVTLCSTLLFYYIVIMVMVEGVTCALVNVIYLQKQYSLLHAWLSLGV